MANPSLDTLTGSGGHFRVFVTPPGGKAVDVTMFRDVPTEISSLSSVDPFGDATGSMNFPAITGYDRPGQGDLTWLVPFADVDVYYALAGGGYHATWKWEGQIVSEEVGGDTYGVQLRGALFQLDSFKAAPWFPQYPVPYEKLIQMAMDPKTHPTLRSTALRTTFPSGWKTKVPKFDEPSYLWFLRPWGVSPGQNWTGLTTRSTGSWEPVLTGFIQTLLSVMYTEDGGQWTIRKDPGRSPHLLVRPALTAPTAYTLDVYYGVPGVEMSFSRDFSQSANVIYGEGTDLNGSAFSGQQVTNDGQSTYYQPMAALPLVYPANSANPRLLKNFARQESHLQFPPGLDEVTAREVAATQLRRFSDPGYTGTITLQTDPLLGGEPFSRMLIKAGQSILVHGIRGTDILFHISEATISPTDGTVSLTVDSKFRDQLTIAEVRARTRDALDPVRLMQVGRLSVTTQDQIKPWSYSSGSGVMPSGGAQDATELFTKKMTPTTPFPWTTFTTKYPPKKYPKYYIKIEPRNTNATKNWSGQLREGTAVAGIPIKMSQAGSIRLSQIAAYDENGNVLPVRFHISLYGSSGINVTNMPTIPAAMGGKYSGYAAAQHYPFFPGAFETVNPDGTEVDNKGQMLPAGADLVIGWGNYYERAGYWPGKFSAGGIKTGLMVDEANWSYDTSNQRGFDKYSTKNTQKDPTAGMLYAMIYCDDQGTNPVYFLGRFFRSEAS